MTASRRPTDVEEQARKLADRKRDVHGGGPQKWTKTDNENARKRAKETYEDPEKLQMLKSAFELFDLDGGGSIEASELHVLLEGLGINISEEAAMDLVLEAPKIVKAVTLIYLTRSMHAPHCVIDLDDDLHM